MSQLEKILPGDTVRIRSEVFPGAIGRVGRVLSASDTVAVVDCEPTNQWRHHTESVRLSCLDKIPGYASAVSQKSFLDTLDDWASSTGGHWSCGVRGTKRQCVLHFTNSGGGMRPFYGSTIGEARAMAAGAIDSGEVPK